METTTRRGSTASDKQLGRAAAEGKTARFYTDGVDKPPVLGYLVGMDDYHWTVATLSSAEMPEDRVPLVTLVHRSCPLISISPEPTLAVEPEAYREWLTGVGGKFWEFCSKKYLGKPVPSSTNE